MKNFIARALRAARHFTIFDYSLFKIALVSFGILLGSNFADFFASHQKILWLIFLFSYILLLLRTFLIHKF